MTVEMIAMMMIHMMAMTSCLLPVLADAGSDEVSSCRVSLVFPHHSGLTLSINKCLLFCAVPVGAPRLLNAGRTCHKDASVVNCSICC